MNVTVISTVKVSSFIFAEVPLSLQDEILVATTSVILQHAGNNSISANATSTHVGVN